MRLWVPHQMQTHAYIRTLVADRAATEDILQETAAVAWRKFDLFEPGTRFDQWVYRIAHNQVLYYARKRRRDLLMFGDELLEQIAEESAAESSASNDYLHALESCLQKLAEHDRRLVRKRYAAGATNRSVSQEVGRSESAISRALNRIQLALLHCIHAALAVGPGGSR